MIVLSRRIRESIKIGEEITITVLNMDRGKIQLGVLAPGKIPIHREEIYHRIRAEGEHRLFKGSPQFVEARQETSEALPRCPGRLSLKKGRKQRTLDFPTL
jgi:carbon storage regulator